MCRVKCVGMERVGWKLKQTPYVRSSEVVWKAMELLSSSRVNDCGEQPACVSCATFVAIVV